MSKVSVIIPAYNQAPTLAAAIESVLGQSYPDLECVVVNDGSTDETAQVLARYLGHPSLKLIEQENCGVGAARNRGIQASSGSYLCFLDADDLYHPPKLEKQAAFLEAEPEYSWTYCDIASVDADGQPLEDSYSVGQGRVGVSGDILPLLMQGGYFPPHTVMLRRAVLEQVGLFDPALGGHADYDLWLRIARAGFKAYYLDEKLAIYRRSEGSMSRDTAHMQATLLGSLRKMADDCPEAMAQAVMNLQALNRELHTANQWLNQHWLEAYAAAPALPESQSAGESYSFLLHFRQGQLLSDDPAQAAVWDVTLEGKTSQAIFLQPPAQLSFNLPEGGAGRLSWAVAIHPDAWDQPGAGRCVFTVRVDDHIACQVSLDPTHLPGERRWHQIQLEVPENPNGGHTVVFQTHSPGPVDYRWALFEAPCFTYDSLPEQDR